MIKLNVEIKGDSFIYSYEIGGDTHNGQVHLCADNLASFNDLLRICSNASTYAHKIWERDSLGKAYLEKQAISTVCEDKK